MYQLFPPFEMAGPSYSHTATIPKASHIKAHVTNGIYLGGLHLLLQSGVRPWPDHSEPQVPQATLMTSEIDPSGPIRLNCFAFA